MEKHFFGKLNQVKCNHISFSLDAVLQSKVVEVSDVL